MADTSTEAAGSSAPRGCGSLRRAADAVDAGRSHGRAAARPSWVGSALPRGPIWSADPGQELPRVGRSCRPPRTRILEGRARTQRRALLGLRVTRADLLGHAYRDSPSIHLDRPPLPNAPATLGQRRRGRVTPDRPRPPIQASPAPRFCRTIPGSMPILRGGGQRCCRRRWPPLSSGASGNPATWSNGSPAIGPPVNQ